jgi:hypothetical protein
MIGVGSEHGSDQVASCCLQVRGFTTQIEAVEGLILNLQLTSWQNTLANDNLFAVKVCMNAMRTFFFYVMWVQLTYFSWTSSCPQNDSMQKDTLKIRNSSPNLYVGIHGRVETYRLIVGRKQYSGVTKVTM